MKSNSGKYFTPVYSAADNSDFIDLAGNRFYTESDYMNKSQNHVIKVWPYLPSRPLQISANNSAV